MDADLDTLATALYLTTSSDRAGWAEYGYCASHSRYFWGLRPHWSRPSTDSPSGGELEEAYLAHRLYLLSVKNRRLCVRRKLWKAARQAGILSSRSGEPLGRDQVERLMKIAGISGIRRGKHRTVTTTSDPKAPWHPDHIKRRWSAPTRPDEWWVADFTYVWTLAGFC